MRDIESDIPLDIVQDPIDHKKAAKFADKLGRLLAEDDDALSMLIELLLGISPKPEKAPMGEEENEITRAGYRWDQYCIALKVTEILYGYTAEHSDNVEDRLREINARSKKGKGGDQHGKNQTE